VSRVPLLVFLLVISLVRSSRTVGTACPACRLGRSSRNLKKFVEYRHLRRYSWRQRCSWRCRRLGRTATFAPGRLLSGCCGCGRSGCLFGRGGCFGCGQSGCLFGMRQRMQHMLCSQDLGLSRNFGTRCNGRLSIILSWQSFNIICICTTSANNRQKI
jgi:hypothetical protein